MIYPEAFVHRPHSFFTTTGLTDDAIGKLEKARESGIDIHSLPWRKIVDDQYETIIKSNILNVSKTKEEEED